LGTAGTEQIFEKSCKKLARWQDKLAALKAYKISRFFINTQIGYYKKGMCHAFANFLRCNITKYCKNQSTFD